MPLPWGDLQRQPWPDLLGQHLVKMESGKWKMGNGKWEMQRPYSRVIKKLLT